MVYFRPTSRFTGLVSLAGELSVSTENMTKYTPFSFIQERIDTEFEELNKRVTSWLMFFASNKGEIELHGGKMITPHNIEFSNSIRLFYWQNFIQPFLKESISNTFEITRKFNIEHSVDPKKMIDETYEILKVEIESIFRQMVDIDQKIRGKGYPKLVDRYKPDVEKEQMIAFLEERYSAELAIIPKEKSKLDKFYEEQKFSIWVIGILVSLLGIVIKFC